MSTLLSKIEFFEKEMYADINERNGETFATIRLQEEAEWGEHSDEMKAIWEKVSNNLPDQEGYLMGTILDEGDHSKITFKLK